MLTNETLAKHVADIDAACRERLKVLIPTMAKKEDVTEQLKAADQMEGVHRMNNIKNRVEESIFQELIYDWQTIYPEPRLWQDAKGGGIRLFVASISFRRAFLRPALIDVILVFAFRAAKDGAGTAGDKGSHALLAQAERPFIICQQKLNIIWMPSNKELIYHTMVGLSCNSR